MKRLRYPLLLLWLAVPRAASAHNMIKGAPDFYNGLLHPFFSLPHLLAVIALGLISGLQRERAGNWVSLAFLGALVVGFGCAVLSIGFPAETALLACAFVLGIALLAGRGLPPLALGAAAVVTGVLMGLDFYSDEAKSKVALQTGTGLCLYFCYLYALLMSENFVKKPWQRIGLRVVGSWIAATALLVLSLKVFVRT